LSFTVSIAVFSQKWKTRFILRSEFSIVVNLFVVLKKSYAVVNVTV